MRLKDLFKDLRGSIRMGHGVPGGQGGCLGDPIGPSGWFDESLDDS